MNPRAAEEPRNRGAPSGDGAPLRNEANRVGRRVSPEDEVHRDHARRLHTST